MVKKIAFIVTLVLSPAWATALQAITGNSTDSLKTKDKSTLDSAEGSVFVVKSGPPSGFEVLAKNPHQDTYVSFFYDGVFITNVMADFSDNNIKIKNPNLIVEKIPHLNQAKKAEMIKGLSGSLPTHPELLCPYGQGVQCHTLSPEVVGVIFDAQNYRADVFVNPDYLDIIRHDHDALPNSSAGFSVLSQNLVQATKIQGFRGATWGNTTILGDGNNELSGNFSYTQSWTDPNPISNTGGQTEITRQFNLNSVTAGRYQNGVLYQAGMINQNAGEFFTSPTLGGVNIQNYGIFTDLSSEIVGSPLVVYLPMAGTVVVKKQGQILAAVSLPPGKQSLDTTTFPVGSYNVDITITTQTGEVSTQTQFYVKQTTLPEYGHHNFDVAVGVLQKSSYNQSLNQIVSSPSFMNVPIFSYYDMRKIQDHLGLSSGVITSGPRTYLSEVLHYYQHNIDFSPGGAISSQGDSGVRLGADYSNSFMSLGFQGFKTWPKQAFLLNNSTSPLSLINQSSATFYPLPMSLSQAQGNISFFRWGNQINLGGGWYKNFDGSISKTENISYNRTLIQSETGNLLLGLSLTHQNQQVATLGGMTSVVEENTIGLASLTYNFFTPVVTGDAVLKLSNQLPDLDGNQPYQPGFLTSVGHASQTDTQHGWTVTGSLDAERHYQSGGLSFNGVTPMVSGDFSVTRNLFDPGYGQNNNQYNLSLQSTVAYAGGHLALGSSQGYSTGIVVEVDSEKPAEFSLYDNDYFIGRLSTNQPHSLFVMPYSVHRFTIQPGGQDIYHFDQNPKETVLYQGNVEYLHWALEKQYILFAKIVDKTGKPLVNYLLDNQGEYDTTDDFGYVQAGLTPSMTSLTFVGIQGDRCLVSLPKTLSQKISGNVAVLDEPLRCD